MMFKVIPMHTKPLKHAKYIEILTKYIEKHREERGRYNSVVKARSDMGSL